MLSGMQHGKASHRLAQWLSQYANLALSPFSKLCEEVIALAAGFEVTWDYPQESHIDTDFIYKYVTI